jgi:hypothetical protein
VKRKNELGIYLKDHNATDEKFICTGKHAIKHGFNTSIYL